MVEGDSIDMPRQVEMEDEQYFAQCGRMRYNGHMEKVETTQCILKLRNKIE